MTGRQDIERAAMLMEIAANMIAEHCPDAMREYDGTQCDGYCLSDDLQAQAEHLRAELGAPDADVIAHRGWWQQYPVHHYWQCRCMKCWREWEVDDV